MFMSKLYKN